MDTFRRIFGLGPKQMQPRPSFTQSMTEDGKERVQMYEDLSATAQGARHNFSMIYGASNLPPTFGMRSVIEVKNDKGEWQPVSGDLRNVPDMDTQMAFLQSWRESGIIGPQAVNPDGSLSTSDNPIAPRNGEGLNAKRPGDQHPGGATQKPTAKLAAQTGLGAAQQMMLEALPDILKNVPDDKARQRMSQRVLDDLTKRAMVGVPETEQEIPMQSPAPVIGAGAAGPLLGTQNILGGSGGGIRSRLPDQLSAIRLF